MDVRFDGQKLTIDDIIDVTQKGNDYFFQCGYHKIAVTAPGSTQQQRGITSGWLGVEQDPMQQEDPHYYKNGNNGLTVEQSADRAFEHIVYNTWYAYDEIDIGDDGLLFDAITNLIKDGDGRDSAYAIAGTVVKGVREGRFKGVPLALLFYGIAEGHIKEPVKVDSGRKGLPSLIRF